MDAFIEWAMSKATGDNVLALGLLILIVIAGRFIYWWGFRPRDKDNPNDVGILTDYHEVATDTLRQMGKTIPRIEGKLDQVLDGAACRNFAPADPNKSGIHGGR